MTFDEYMEIQMRDPEYRKIHEFLQPERDACKALIRYRLNNNISVRQISKILGVRDEDVADFELGLKIPSLKYMHESAKLLGFSIEINIEKI